MDTWMGFAQNSWNCMKPILILSMSALISVTAAESSALDTCACVVLRYIAEAKHAQTMNKARSCRYQ